MTIIVPKRSFGLALAFSTLVTANLFAADKVNYQDNMLPLFRDNCLTCHNADKKKAGLDLSNFQAAMAGSNNGPVINSGDPDGSLLYRAVTHAEEPTMPPKREKLPQKDLDQIKSWIVGGALETATGKPIASSKPKINLSVTSLAIARPQGPPPMPSDLVIEPFVHSSRPWAAGCLAASPWAPVVAVGGQHQVLLYQSQTLELLGIVPFPEGDPRVVRFSRNGKMLLIAGGVAAKSGKAVLWDITAGKRVTDVGEEFDEVLAADLSPDQTAVALGGPGKTLKIYSTQDGSVTASVKKHTDWVTAISYSPDGVLLASADRAGGLWVWEAKTAREFYNLAGHKAGVSAVAFRDDSNFLASASEDGTIKLWDMENGKNVKSWQAHGGGVLSIAFTHDGRLVSCGRDRVVKLWKADGSQIRQLDAFNDIALDATFDDTGKHVVATDWTGEVRVWDADTGKLAGKLDPNPPPLASRIAVAQATIDKSAVTRETGAAQLAAAKTSAEQATRELQKAQAAIAQAKQSIELDREKVKGAESALALKRAGKKSADESLAARRSDVDRVSQALANGTGDAAHDREELEQAKQALVAAQQECDTRGSEVAALAGELQTASDSLTRAKADLDEATKALPGRANQSKSIDERLTTLTSQAQAAESSWKRQNQELARLKAGQIFQTVYAARSELETCASEEAKGNAALASAKAEAEKAATAVASARKALDEGPARIAQRESEIDRAKHAFENATHAVADTRRSLEKRQALAAQGADILKQVATAAADTPDDAGLRDAVTKTQIAADSLSTSVETARLLLSANMQEEKKTQEMIASAEAALVKERRENGNAPATLARLVDAAQAANAQIDALSAAVTESARLTALARSRAELLKNQYEKAISSLN